MSSKQGFCTKITSHQNTAFTPHYHFPFCKYRHKEANDEFLHISVDRDKWDTLWWLGVVSHALSEVIVYFGVKQKTRRQNELKKKITSTVLAASSSLLFSPGALFFFLVFTLEVCLPDSFFSIVNACFLLCSGGVSLRVPWGGVRLLILTKLCSDAGFGSFTPQWTLTLNLGFDGKRTLLWPCYRVFLFTFTTVGFFQESGVVTIVMASFKLPWR